MKPKNIILVRHGESTGNVSKDEYLKTPDYALVLTEEGRRQAVVAGAEIRSKIQEGKLTRDLVLPEAMVYCSSYYRTRQTYEGIKKNLNVWRYYETPQLREQEWGTTFEGVRNYQKAKEDIEKFRDENGKFYYRFDSGENIAQVYDRVSLFMDTLFRDFEKPDFPENVLIVTHGMTLRVFLMRWFHWTVEEFETVKNPKNCEFFVLTSKDRRSKYELVTELNKQDSQNKFKFEWQE